MFPIAGGSNSVTMAAKECGIHVRNVANSLAGTCDNITQVDFTPTSCATSSNHEILTEIDGINVWYDVASRKLRVSIDTDTPNQLPLMVFDAVGHPIFSASCSYGDNMFPMNKYPSGFYSVFIIGDQTQFANSFIKQ